MTTAHHDFMSTAAISTELIAEFGPQHPDIQYLDVGRDILNNGVTKVDRTQVGTLSTFGQRMTFDLKGGKLPLLTTKKVANRSIVHELLWMLSGSTNVRYLIENNVHIWDSWVDPRTAEYDPEDPERLVAGEVPHIYGKQWRRWEDNTTINAKAEPVDFSRQISEMEKDGYTFKARYFDAEEGCNKALFHRTIDQIKDSILGQLKNNPDSRRIILTAWNPAETHLQGLPPCHPFTQFWTRELTLEEREVYTHRHKVVEEDYQIFLGTLDDLNDPTSLSARHDYLTELDIPERALQCQFTMR